MTLNSYIYEGISTTLLMLSILFTRNVYIVAATYFLLLLVGDKEHMGFINPAITFAMAVSGSITSRSVLYYWIAQFVGALLGLQIYVSMTRS